VAFAWAANLPGGREETREVLVIRFGHAHSGRQELGEGTCERSRQLLPCSICASFSAAAPRHPAAIPGRRGQSPRDSGGLVVDEVLGFRRFAEAEFNAEAPPTVIRCDSYLAGPFAAAAKSGRC